MDIDDVIRDLGTVGGGLLSVRDPGGVADAQPFRDAIDTLADWVGPDGEPPDMLERTRRAVAASRIIQGFEPHVAPLRWVGRNDPCPCGSGKKYKKCCLR